MIGCDGFCVVLRDEALCHYAAEDAMAPLWEGRRFPMEACVSGWAMRTGEIAVIPDIFEDDRVPHALYSQTFVRSLAMAPAGEPADAALGAYWSQRGRPSNRAVEMLQDLAAAVGEALGRVRTLAG
jgi:GAF domain-containing protein